MYCLITTYLLIFQFPFSLISSFLPLQLERILCMISIFFNLLRLVLWAPMYDLSTRMFQVHLRRMCTLPLLGWVFSICLFGLVGLVLFKSSISLLILCLDVLSSIEDEILTSQCIVIELSISPFSSVNVGFIYSGVLLFGIYAFLIAIFPWRIDRTTHLGIITE